MNFELFKKHCSTCGVKIDKNKEINKHSKHFCSEEHAKQYEEKLEKENTTQKPKGGCCG